MKIELKHLAPYLPYGVKVSHIHVLHHGIGIGSINHILTSSSNKYKIRLRPLSDLTKEIEVNGKKFVPIEKIYGLMGWELDELPELIERGDVLGIYSDEDLIPYSHAKKLLEWHFDIFGLIEQGLAIDIKILNK